MIRIAAALALLVVAFVTGSIAARIARRWLKKRESAAMQDAADVISSGIFWLLVSVGIVLALSMTDPSQLAPIPGRLLAYFPRIVVAMLMIVGARVAGSLVAHAVVQSVHRATGKINTTIGTVVRIAILAGGVILAVSQLGIDTTIVTILVAALAFSIALGAALVVGLGGRRVASEVAAGRAMRDIIVPGTGLTGNGIEGTVIALQRVGVEVESADGRRFHVPYEQLLGGMLEISRPSS